MVNLLFSAGNTELIPLNGPIQSSKNIMGRRFYSTSQQVKLPAEKEPQLDP